MKNKIVVLGCGRLGASVASAASEKGLNVIVVDEKKESFDRLEEPFSGFTVVGNACDASLLEKDAYISTAQEVVITTGNDNANLYLAHLCSRIYQVPKIIVRFDDPKYEVLIKDLENVRAVYPFELSYRRVIECWEEGR